LTFSITYHDGQIEQFALQLKHRESENKILDARKLLEKGNKQFNISDYCASFEKLTTTIQTNYTFILLTNVTFQKIDEIQSYKTKKCADPFKVKVFNTDNIYQFQELNTKSQAVFYDKFYLLSGQQNVRAIEKAIFQIFREKFHSDSNTAICYIHFFGNLRLGSYINSEITRDEVILKLTSLLLSNHVIRIPLRAERNKKIQQLEEAIQQFDITLIQDVDQEFVKDNWCYSHRQDNLVEDWARNNKMLPKQSQDPLDEKEKQLLHYLLQNLVFVNVTTNCEDVVYKVVNLCRSTKKFKLNFVLIGKEVKNKFVPTGTEEEDFRKWKIFEDLTQLESNQCLYYDMMTSNKISLQGRNAECLATLKTKFDLHLDEFITPDVLFQMLEGDLVVGTPIEKLSGYYIPRTLRKAAFSYKHLGAICERNTVIVECSGKSKIFGKLLNAELGNLKILDLNSYQQNPSHYKKSTVVLTDQKFYHSNHSVICLQLIQHNKLAWSDNKINEGDLNISGKHAKAIFGSSGIGKTVMMKRFANECPLKYWVVMVPLTQQRSFLKNEPTTADVLKQFLNSDKKIDQQVIKYFQRLKQILFLFDGVDELDNKTITIVVSVVKQLIDEGYQILIFGRTYLKEMLTTELQIYFVYEIEELKKEDMKEYIHQHLKGKQIETKNIEVVARKILENYTEEIILKVPLLLFIVLEIVSGYKNLDSLEEIPSVSEMYPRFIEGRLQHNLAKAKYDYADRSNIVVGIFKRYYLREYQIAALKSCLDPKVLERLNISPDRYFVKLIKNRGDFLGLVTEINRSDTFVFCHHTFAEYFVALWLSENIEKLSHEERRFIFEEKYSRVRYFFDTELGKNCPLHQAVLKQNVSEVEKLAPDYFNRKDRKGRTPLHLASSLGQKFPVLENTEIRNNQNVELMKILQCLLNMEQIDPLQKDKLFEWNCFEYADASLCLLALEELSKKRQFQLKHLTNYRNVNILCNHCVCLGCINILSILIKFEGLSNLDRLGKPLLHIAIEYGQNEVVKLLLKNGADMRTCSKGRTPLHEAVMWGHLDILNTFLDTNLNTTKRDCRGNAVLQFDINKKDGRGNTPLQFAAELGYFNIVKLLIDRGAQVNTTDKLGKTPLHKAACMHNRNIVEHLINNGADPNIKDKEHWTVLQLAVRMGQLEVVKCLIEKNININVVDRAGKTALHHAAFHGLKDIVEYLVTKGINVIATDEDGKTALELAEKRKQQDIVEYLKNAEKNTKRYINLLYFIK
jgi:ankyrin repeat protein